MNERETLLARAKELGLELPGNISNAKLKKAVAGKEAQLDAASGVGGDKGPVQSSDADELVDAIVLDQLKHNGKDYSPDDPVELTQKQFERLEHLGVVAAAEAD
ncbi:hypothetical protein [Parasedimentitalea psychrophila]|uniref:Uncharacterized protein n=1 Tax=Parasedimentitalea psychrophila TaxID=2997337 RepID=A0A9Y2KYV6_9RHOB|nr:hypothetical protein [Parasedimentitalea psychrophila]WIY25058.1 hypothetical protein QPJ95_21635 [Parasedimentitalea psychrophila]